MDQPVSIDSAGNGVALSEFRLVTELFSSISGASEFKAGSQLDP